MRDGKAGMRIEGRVELFYGCAELGAKLLSPLIFLYLTICTILSTITCTKHYLWRWKYDSS